MNRQRVHQRILATGVFVAGRCEAGGSRWAGVTDPSYSFRQQMPESVRATTAAVQDVATPTDSEGSLCSRRSIRTVIRKNPISNMNKKLFLEKNLSLSYF
jgi:hypothetical protein